MRRALIIGASRGIGLGLVDAHLKEDWLVTATTRDGHPPRDHSRLTTHRLDVRNEEELAAIVSIVAEPFERIVHNAGILRANRSALMEINARAPIRIMDVMLEAGMLIADGSIAIMTSQMGARRGRSGTLGAYGDSKAALNDEFRRKSDLWRAQGAVAVVMHPGWVRTDMGGSGASLSVSESAHGIKRVLDELVVDDHGKFLTWDGRVHPW